MVIEYNNRFWSHFGRYVDYFSLVASVHKWIEPTCHFQVFTTKAMRMWTDITCGENLILWCLVSMKHALLQKKISFQHQDICKWNLHAKFQVSMTNSVAYSVRSHRLKTFLEHFIMRKGPNFWMINKKISWGINSFPLEEKKFKFLQQRVWLTDEKNGIPRVFFWGKVANFQINRNKKSWQ